MVHIDLVLEKLIECCADIEFRQISRIFKIAKLTNFYEIVKRRVSKKLCIFVSVRTSSNFH